MSKPLTKARAEAVERFAKTLKQVCPDITEKYDLDSLVADHVEGAGLKNDYTHHVAKAKKPCCVKKTSWWKRMLGLGK